MKRVAHIGTPISIYVGRSISIYVGHQMLGEYEYCSKGDHQFLVFVFHLQKEQMPWKQTLSLRCLLCRNNY